MRAAIHPIGVRELPFLALGAMTFGLAFGLAISFQLVYQGCAPPSLNCLKPDVVCATVCLPASTHLAALLEVGAALGIVPGLAAFGAVFVYSGKHRTRRGDWSTSSLIEMVCILLGTFAVYLTYPSIMDTILELTALFGAAIAVLMSSGWFFLRAAWSVLT